MTQKLQIDGVDIADIPYDVAEQLKSAGPYSLDLVEYTPEKFGIDIDDHHRQTYKEYIEGSLVIKLHYKDTTR